jgi:dTDP-4-dehydrorhamnose reductase
MEKMKKKILVLGSTGMLGHVFYNALKQQTNYEVVDLVFRNKLNENSIICDVTDKYKLAAVIKELNPDIIVNCIGVLIKGSTYNPANAIYINSFLPHYLVTLAVDCSARVIHVSTDCVFSGNKGEYLESDYRDANDVYGRSKALGELLGDNHLTIRTSIIGPEIKAAGEGLLHWFLKQEVSIMGYTEAFWGGVTTVELSKAIVAAIDQNITGLIHLTNGEAISKFEMLQMFKTTFNRNSLTIESSEGKKINKSLKSERKDFKYSVPSYAQMFTDMYNHMKDNELIYSKNYIFND